MNLPSVRVRWPEGFVALANRRFRVLWSGVFFSMAGNQMDMVARAWLAYHISGSGLTLGLVSLARGLPQVVLLPIAGVVADRMDKRTILVISQSSLAVLGLLNAVLVQMNVIQIWQLSVIGLLQGATFSFSGPTRHAYIPSMVTAKELPSAIAVTNTALHLNGVLAPVIAGVLMARSPSLAFYAVMASYAVAALTLFALPRHSPISAARLGATVAKQLVDGYRHIAGHGQLRRLIATAFVPIVIGMPVLQLLPVFQEDVLKVGPSSLGLMYTAVGVGSLGSSLLFAYITRQAPAGLLMAVTGMGFGLSVAAFALSTNYAVSVAMLALVGVASQGYLALNSLSIMLHASQEFYGRVMSIYMLAWGLMPVAVLPMGVLIDIAGPRVTVATIGVVLAVLTGAAALPHALRKPDA